MTPKESYKSETVDDDTFDVAYVHNHTRYKASSLDQTLYNEKGDQQSNYDTDDEYRSSNGYLADELIYHVPLKDQISIAGYIEKFIE